MQIVMLECVIKNIVLKAMLLQTRKTSGNIDSYSTSPKFLFMLFIPLLDFAEFLALPFHPYSTLYFGLLRLFLFSSGGNRMASF